MCAAKKFSPAQIFISVSLKTDSNRLSIGLGPFGPYPERRLFNMGVFDSNVYEMFSNNGWFPDNPVGSILVVKNASSDNTTIRTHNTYSWYFSSDL